MKGNEVKPQTHPRISVKVSDCRTGRAVESALLFDYAEFSGGEVHVRLHQSEGISGVVTITADLRNAADIMALLAVTDAVRRAGSPFCPPHIELIMPYLPYARQDRKCNGGESLTLKVFCGIINAQNYSVVEVWDVHSEVGVALLDRCRHRTVTDIFDASSLLNPLTMTLVAPDAGASKRVGQLAKHYHVDYVQCGKSRNVADGSLSNPVVYLDPGTKSGRDFLIVDDICDGGRTFIALAAELRKFTTGKVNLYVTHGIFSQGFDVFDGLIDNIFVANSFRNDLPNNVHNLRGFIK